MIFLTWAIKSASAEPNHLQDMNFQTPTPEALTAEFACFPAFLSSVSTLKVERSSRKLKNTYLWAWESITISFHSTYSKKSVILARMPPNAEYHILGENSEIGDELRKTEPTSVFSGPHLPLEALIWLKIGTESTNQENRRQKISFGCPPSVHLL